MPNPICSLHSACPVTYLVRRSGVRTGTSSGPGILPATLVLQLRSNQVVRCDRHAQVLVPRLHPRSPAQSAEGGGSAFAQGPAVIYILMFYVLRPAVTLCEAEHCMSLVTRRAELTGMKRLLERPPRCRQEWGSPRGASDTCLRDLRDTCLRSICPLPRIKTEEAE